MSEVLALDEKVIGKVFKNDKLKIFFDAEFTGLHKNTTLISIGLISDNGTYFYAEFNDYDKNQVDDWLQEHVIDNLLHNDCDIYFEKTQNKNELCSYNINMKDSTKNIGFVLNGWLRNEYLSSGKQIQFCTDCYAYDWVLLNDLICEDGLALNLPDYINYIPIDLSTLFYSNGIDPDISREEFGRGLHLSKIINSIDLLKDLDDKSKHNSLWDAAVIKSCFYQLISPMRNGRIYDPNELRDAFIKATNNMNKRFMGEIDHPNETKDSDELVEVCMEVQNTNMNKNKRIYKNLK